MKSALPPAKKEPREELIQIGSQDFLRAFRLRSMPWLAGLVRSRAERFADEALAFDRVVAEHGLLAGADTLLQRHTKSVTFHGHAPSTGPLLIVSNHPGMMDAMAVWRGVGRDDLVTVAADRDLLRALPGILGHLLIIDEAKPTAGVRSTIDHLRRGGAVLTFPAGRIEPDPALLPACPRAEPDLALFQRKVPDLQVVRATVSGVISERAFRLPWLRVFRDPMDRSWAAATLQVAFPRFRAVEVEVRFEPLS